LLFRNLGMCLVFNKTAVLESGQSTKKDEKDKEKLKQDLQLLNDVWKIVTNFDDPSVIKR
jgi:hypothetical protein